MNNTVVPGCDAATLCTGTCGSFHPADSRHEWLGDCTCGLCRDGRIDECEALSYARWQRGDHEDMAGAIRGLYIAAAGGCYGWDAATLQWVSTSCE